MVCQATTRSGGGHRGGWFVFGGLALAVASLLILRNRPWRAGMTPVGAEAEEAVPPSQERALSWASVYLSPTVSHVGVVYAAFGFSYIIYVTFFVKCLIAEGGYAEQSAGRLFMIVGWFS